jgi:hypothetical protein
MSKLANIIGFSLFGLAARFGQLGIQKRNLFESEYFPSSTLTSNMMQTLLDMQPQSYSLDTVGTGHGGGTNEPQS